MKLFEKNHELFPRITSADSRILSTTQNSDNIVIIFLQRASEMNMKYRCDIVKGSGSYM